MIIKVIESPALTYVAHIRQGFKINILKENNSWDGKEFIIELVQLSSSSYDLVLTTTRCTSGKHTFICCILRENVRDFLFTSFIFKVDPSNAQIVKFSFGKTSINLFRIETTCRFLLYHIVLVRL